MVTSSFSALFQRLGHRFDDISLLETALTHRSFSALNNERLEFLGDSILNFVIAESIFQKFPFASEGELTRLRANLVSGKSLANVAIQLELDDFLKMSAGEYRSGGTKRPSIQADVVEAIIAAIYLDSGFEKAKQCVLTWFSTRLSTLSLVDIQKDSKTRLQEYLQSRKYSPPNYAVLSVEGEPHQQTFHVECTVKPLDVKTNASGSSRRQAEQNAANLALEALK